MAAPLPDGFRILQRIRTECFNFCVSVVVQSVAFAVPTSKQSVFQGYFLFYRIVYAAEKGR
jgi:hypothetical protein